MKKRFSKIISNLLVIAFMTGVFSTVTPSVLAAASTNTVVIHDGTVNENKISNFSLELTINDDSPKVTTIGYNIYRWDGEDFDALYESVSISREEGFGSNVWNWSNEVALGEGFYEVTAFVVDETGLTIESTNRWGWFLIPEGYDFTVTLDSQKGTEETASVNGVISKALPNIIVPLRTGYDFIGYFTDTNGSGIQYYNDLGESVRNWDIQADTTLYAHWMPKTFSFMYQYTCARLHAKDDILIPGVSISGSAEVKYGEKIGDLLPSERGFTLDTWYDGNDNVVTSETVWTYLSNQSFEAQGIPNEYTVTYNANGGTGTTRDSFHKYNLYDRLTENSFSYDGKKFKGWSLTKDGPVSYSNGETVYNISADNGAIVTLYAVWEDIPTYTITYNANGGTNAPYLQRKYADTPINLSIDSPIRENYTFIGWAETQDATVATWQPGNSYSVNAPMTLYAVWVKAYVIGDLNADGAVNAKDVTRLRRYLAGGWPAPDDVINELVGDCFWDGVVNAKDVTRLRRYIAGGWPFDDYLGETREQTRISDNEIILNETVEEIGSTASENELISFNAETNTYIFANINSEIRNLQKGDKFVILPCAEITDGCAIIVNSITVDGNTATIVSREVKFSDIVESLDVLQMIPLTENMITDYGEGVTPRMQSTIQSADQMHPAAIVEATIPPLDIELSVGDNFQITGSIEMHPELEVDIDLNHGWFGLPTGVDRFLVAVNNNLSANLKLEATAGGEIVDMASVYRLQDGKLNEKYANYILAKAKADDYTKRLFTADFPIPVTPGLAVTITWYITVTADGAISIEAVYEQNISQGILMEDEEWTSINENNTSITLAGAADASIYTGVGMEIGLSFVKVVAAHITPEVGLEISGSTTFFDDEQDEILHDCKLCVDGDVDLRFEIGADVTAIGFGAIREGYILSPGATKIDDFYISYGGVDHGTQWGFGECPYDNDDSDNEDYLAGSSFFNGHNYKVFDEGISWYEAKRECESMGGHLATITSQEEQNFLAGMINKGNQVRYWLGGSDDAVEGEWSWVTDEAFTFTNWVYGEPNNQSSVGSGAPEGYLEINKSNKQWNDLQNNGDSVEPLSDQGFICEWEEIN
jgi:hypothetical protein